MCHHLIVYKIEYLRQFYNLKIRISIYHLNDTSRGLPLTRSRIDKIFPKLTPEQTRRIATRGGQMRKIQIGEILVEQGDGNVPFFMVVFRGIEVVRPCGSVETLVTIHGPGEFTGEVNMLSGRRSIVRTCY